MTNLRVIGNRVLVKRLDAEEKTIGGIMIPDAAQKKQDRAVVVSVGTGSKDTNGDSIPIPVSINDIIMFAKYTGQEITVDGEELLILRTEDIIAIVE